MKKDVLTSSFLDIRSKMHRIAMRLLHNDEDAKDAIQDTFEKLWSKIEIKSDEEARYKLVHILHNTCIDRLRGKHTIQMDLSEMEKAGTYEMQTENIAEYEQLILIGLTDLQRKIYILVTHDCLEYEEVATQLNMTVESVRMNMSRARRKISDNIKKIDR